MQDLVQMMTQTLRMDVREAVCEPDGCSIGSRALPEFRLNRRYRDTLLLHGKAREEQDFPFSEIPTGQSVTRILYTPGIHVGQETQLHTQSEILPKTLRFTFVTKTRQGQQRSGGPSRSYGQT